MSNSALCAALNSLIEDCTVILGWCFSSEEVDKTKLKQKEVTHTVPLSHFWNQVNSMTKCTP